MDVHCKNIFQKLHVIRLPEWKLDVDIWVFQCVVSTKHQLSRNVFTVHSKKTHIKKITRTSLYQYIFGMLCTEPLFILWKLYLSVCFFSISVVWPIFAFFEGSTFESSCSIMAAALFQYRNHPNGESKILQVEILCGHIFFDSTKS